MISDAYSKWVFTKVMKRITTEETIAIFREYFGQWGLPCTLISDNGSSFCSEEMQKFLKDLGIKHIMTPPYHPATNGQAENSVRTVKKFLKKCNWRTLDDELFKFLLMYNNTPHMSTGVSPAQLQVNRNLITKLHRIFPSKKLKELKLNRNSEMKVEKIQRKSTSPIKCKKSFTPGEVVMVKCYSYNKSFWKTGKVVEMLSPVTYLVQLPNGLIKKNHCDQMSKTNVEFKISQENINNNVNFKEIDSEQNTSHSEVIVRDENDSIREANSNGHSEKVPGSNEVLKTGEEDSLSPGQSVAGTSTESPTQNQNTVRSRSGRPIKKPSRLDL